MVVVLDLKAQCVTFMGICGEEEKMEIKIYSVYVSKINNLQKQLQSSSWV